MKIIYEEGDPCPICGKPLVEEEIDDGEDCPIFLKCPEDKSHYSRFLGYWDDLNE